VSVTFCHPFPWSGFPLTQVGTGTSFAVTAGHDSVVYFPSLSLSVTLFPGQASLSHKSAPARALQSLLVTILSFTSRVCHFLSPFSLARLPSHTSRHRHELCSHCWSRFCRLLPESVTFCHPFPWSGFPLTQVGTGTSFAVTAGHDSVVHFPSLSLFVTLFPGQASLSHKSAPAPALQSLLVTILSFTPRVCHFLSLFSLARLPSHTSRHRHKLCSD